MLYQQILAATDFSNAGNAAAQRAAAIARATGAPLHLAHIIEYFPEDTPLEPIPPEHVDPKTYLQQRAEEALASLAEALDLTAISQEVVISPYGAKHALHELAGRDNADLLVIGSHGHHELSGILGGTATGIVYNATCDVLVVRPDH